jgi:hypothetical protein
MQTYGSKIRTAFRIIIIAINIAVTPKLVLMNRFIGFLTSVMWLTHSCVIATSVHSVNRSTLSIESRLYGKAFKVCQTTLRL